MIKTNWEQAWKGGSTLDWWYVTWCFWTNLSMPKHMFYIVELFRTPKPSARKRFHQMAFIFNKCFLIPQYIIIRLLYWSGGCYNHPFSVYSGAWPIPTVGPTCLIHVFFRTCCSRNAVARSSAHARPPTPGLMESNWLETGTHTLHYRYYRLYLSDPFLVFQDPKIPGKQNNYPQVGLLYCSCIIMVQ